MYYRVFHDHSGQTKSPAGFRDPEPASGSRALGTLPYGFLRPLRLRAGQIRDVARPLGRLRLGGRGVPPLRPSPRKFLPDSAGFSGARIQFFPAAQARPQRPGQTERRGPRVRPRAEKGESRDRPGTLGDFDSGALWHRDSSDDRTAGTEKKTALAAERAGEKHSSRATTPCRGFMKMCVARHSRTRSQLPGPWNAFADMDWPACSPAGNRIFPSFFAHRVFLVRPGAGRETFIARNFLRFMNSLPGR